MVDDTKRSRIWRLSPFLLIALVMLVSGGIALAGVPASVPASLGTGASGAKIAPQQQQGGVTGAAPAQAQKANLARILQVQPLARAYLLRPSRLT